MWLQPDMISTAQQATNLLNLEYCAHTFSYVERAAAAASRSGAVCSFRALQAWRHCGLARSLCFGMTGIAEEQQCPYLFASPYTALTLCSRSAQWLLRSCDLLPAAASLQRETTIYESEDQSMHVTQSRYIQAAHPPFV